MLRNCSIMHSMHGRNETKGFELAYVRVMSRECTEISLISDIRIASGEQGTQEGNSREIK